MQQMQIGWINLLELADSVTVTSADPSAPAYRLYDRLFDVPWTAINTAEQIIKVDQGTLGQEVNALVIPQDHNLAGATIMWQRATVDNDGSYVNVIPPWMQAGEGLILKLGTHSDRFQRLKITGAAAPPQMGELYLTNLHTFRAPDFGSRRATQYNVRRNVGTGGRPSYVKLGPSYTVLSYEMPSILLEDEAFYQAWFEAWDGGKPFFMTDHTGRIFFAEILTEDPGFLDREHNATGVSLRIAQVY